MPAAWSPRDLGVATRSGGLGMSDGSGTPPLGVRKNNTTEESHEETELSSNMN